MFKLIFKIINFIIIISILIVVYSFYIEPKLMFSKTEKIETNILNEEITVIHFTDTHLGDNYSISQLESLVDKINSKKPDLIFFTGDLIDTANSYEHINEIAPVLSKLSARLGKFGVYGNHDHGGGAHRYYPEIMEKSGFVLLNNTSFLLKLNEQQNINVIGVDDATLGKPDLSTTSNLTYSDTLNLVLTHSPDILEDFNTQNPVISFSGHSHGGQVGISFISEKYLPPYGKNFVKGRYQVSENHTLYVSSGIGTTRIPARFLCPPEFIVYKIQ